MTSAKRAAAGAAVLVFAGAPPASGGHRTSFETSGHCTEALVGTLIDHSVAQRHVPAGLALTDIGRKALLIVFSERCTTAVDSGQASASTIGGAHVRLDAEKSREGSGGYTFFWTNSERDTFYRAYRNVGWRMLLDADGRFGLSETGGAAFVTAHNRNDVSSYDLQLNGTAAPPAVPELFLDSVHCHLGKRGLVKAGPFRHEPVAATGAAGTLDVERGTLLWELLGRRESVVAPGLILRFDFSGKDTGRPERHVGP